MRPLPRRHFLKRCAGGLAAATLSHARTPGAVAAPAANARETSLGFSLYGMRTLSLVTALDVCARTGYDAVELPVMPGWPADPRGLSAADRRTVREKLAESGLALVSLMEDAPLAVEAAVHRQQLDRLRSAAELGRELSPAAPPLIESILGGKPDEWPKLKNSFVDRLGDWARVAEEAKTVVAVKPHRFGAMNAPDQAVWLVEQVGSDRIKLVYDYSHFQHRDLPLADTLRTLLPEARFIHVKDARLENGQVRFLLPGDGETDYQDLFSRLREHDYRGCVCVEASGMIHGQPGYDPVKTAEHCYANLAPKFVQAGLKRPR